MFLKNSLRPVAVAAAAETDDFGAFGSPSGTRGEQVRRPQQRPPQQQRGSAPRKPSGSGFSFKPSSVIIAAAAVLAVILLIVLVAVLLSSDGGNVMYENNSFVAICDEDGIWRVASNGNVVAQYENEVTLIPADDRSFAYVIENGDDGYRVHVIKGKNSETITAAPVDKVLATAGLTPGVVWLEADNGICYYSEKVGEEERITKDYSALVEDGTKSGEHNYIFYISDDASTVIYAETNPEKAPEFNLYIYKDSTVIKSQKNLLPVALSSDGKFIYGYGISAKDGVTKAFYVLNEDEEKFLVDEGFDTLIDMNTDGNEIVYTTNTDSGVYTYLYAFNPRKMSDEASPARIGKGVYAPVSPDPEIARFDSFAGAYFMRADEEYDDNAPTYYVSKKFEPEKICNFKGKFAPDGDYFYYTNGENTLMWIDLDDDSHTPNKVIDDVIAFEVTQKGNAYWLNDSGQLKFYDISKDKSVRVFDSVESISMRAYSNTLYFSIEDDVDVYTTSEGSAKDTAKFDSAAITAIPVFVDGNSKKTFAAYWDSDNVEWRLYYTSNGRSFKFVDTCVEIDVISYSDYMDKVVGNNVDNGAIG